MLADSSGVAVLDNLEPGRWAVKVPGWKDWDSHADLEIRRVDAGQAALVEVDVQRHIEGRWVRAVLSSLPEGCEPAHVELQDAETGGWNPALRHGDRSICLPLYDDEDSAVLRMRDSDSGRLFPPVTVGPTRDPEPIELEFL